MPLSLKTIRRSVREPARVVEPLERHSRGRRAVADHRHHALARAAAAHRLGDSERGGDRGARVPGPEGVILAFAAAQEAARSIGALDPREPLPPPGQRLVPVGLMADVPDQPVPRRIEEMVQRDRELHGPEAPGEVPAGLGADADQLRAQRGRDGRELGAREPCAARRDARTENQPPGPHSAARSAFARPAGRPNLAREVSIAPGAPQAELQTETGRSVSENPTRCPIRQPRAGS